MFSIIQVVETNKSWNIIYSLDLLLQQLNWWRFASYPGCILWPSDWLEVDKVIDPWTGSTNSWDVRDLLNCWITANINFLCLVSFKPYNTLRQKLVHPKDKTPKDKQNNIVYGFRCQDNGFEETYIVETKQTLGKRMYQHRCASTSGCRDSAVYTHLNSASHSFDNKDVIIVDRESMWFERGVKKALYVKREQPSLNKGDGCVKIWRGPTVQQLRRSLNVSRIRRPRSRVNNLIHRQSIRRSEDASRIGCETSPVVVKVSPVNRLYSNSYFLFYIWSLYIYEINRSQLAKMKKSIPHMSLA